MAGPSLAPLQAATVTDTVISVLDLKGLAFYAVPTALIVIAFLLGRYGGALVAYLKGPSIDEGAALKLTAKRRNERLKLFATFCNTLGSAIIAAALLAPYLTQHATDLDAPSILWGCGGFGLHLLGQTSLQLMRSEE